MPTYQCLGVDSRGWISLGRGVICFDGALAIQLAMSLSKDSRRWTLGAAFDKLSRLSRRSSVGRSAFHSCATGELKTWIFYVGAESRHKTCGEICMEELEIKSIELGQPSMRSARFVLNREGRRAALEGKPSTANPYDPGSTYGIGWLEGWRSAQARGND